MTIIIVRQIKLNSSRINNIMTIPVVAFLTSKIILDPDIFSSIFLVYFTVPTAIEDGEGGDHLTTWSLDI